MKENKTKFKETEIGLIPEDWEIKSIEKIANINMSCISKNYPYKEIEYIDITAVDKGRILEARTLTLSEAPSRAKRIIKDNDIIISTVRPNLKHFAFIKNAKPNSIVSTGFAVITAQNSIPEYLYFYITTDKYTNFLSAIADSHTSTYPAFNPDVIEKSKIPCPPLPEQKAIAKVLSDLDSKIENLQNQNETLQKIGEAIFKHWFIDFEFPNEEGKPYKSSGGEMVDSELGKIPKGWEIGKLGQIIENFDSKRIPLSSREREKRKGIYPYYGATKIMDYIDDFIFDGTYLLMAEDGSVVDEKGYPVLQYVWGKFWVNNHTHIIKGKDVSTEYIFLLLSKTKVDKYVTGAVQPKINQANMNSIPILIPKKEIICMFDKIIQNVFLKKKIIFEQIKSFKNIRDSLLPKLMSGKIRVPIENVIHS